MSARSISRNVREWRPSEQRRDDENVQRPWLEAPSPYDYRELPPRAETQDNEEEPRVIIIEI